MKPTGSFLRFARGAILCSTVAACSAAPDAILPAGAQARPTPPPASVAAPAASAADCLIMALDTEPFGDINVLRTDATNVVEGTFTGYQKAKWTTPDGHRPNKNEFETDTARLVRPLKIKIKGPEVKGTRDAANRAVQRGGSSGCDDVTYSTEPTLVEGQDYVFLLVPLTNSKQGKTDDYLVLGAYPVGSDGLVDTPANGELTLPELTLGIKNGIPSEPPPVPGEPDPSGPG